jgi:uncharacterized protein HemY
MLDDLHSFGRVLIFIGLFLLILGVLFLWGDKIPIIGKLPGDIHIKKENYSLYIPITSFILLSLLISLIIFLFRR